MDLLDIKSHWTSWAKQYKEDLRATTRTSTIKALEIDAFTRALSKIDFEQVPKRILEVGCGNGHNCFSLARQFPSIEFDGVDFIPEMIDSANNIKSTCTTPAQLNFHVGNILELDSHSSLKDQYGVVFTNRCLINLNTHELQMQAITQLTNRLAGNGYLLLLENQQQTHARQNKLRRSLDLPQREQAEFNVFMDQGRLLEHTRSIGLTMVDTNNFASLHDILLYVLIPAINHGEVDYQHPLMQAATQLCLNNAEAFHNQFGDYGQNQLLVFKKERP